jgi:predicted SnoaL-like aldol condensation-catalyzing enzyme
MGRELMDGEMAVPARHAVVARYFEMWNTGDSSIAAQILCPGWTDHAHLEVTGPGSVRLAVGRLRAAQPDLRFAIMAILGDGDLVAAVGEVSRGPGIAASRLVWLIRLEGNRMAEMWTYHAAPSPEE